MKTKNMCPFAKKLVEKNGTALHVQGAEYWYPTDLYYHVLGCTSCALDEEEEMKEDTDIPYDWEPDFNATTERETQLSTYKEKYG